jgi:hypothetical protein
MENAKERTVKAGRPKKQIGPGRPKLRHRSYRLALQFVHRQNLANRLEWEQFCAGTKLPGDIPKRPDLAYTERWTGWQDWLGTGFVSYQEAKALIAPLNLLTHEDYKAQYHTFCPRPHRLPIQPDLAYKDEWEGWTKYLGRTKQYRPPGHGNPQNLVPFTKGTHYRPYMEAVKFVSRLGLRDHVEWLKWRGTYQADDLPWRPDEVYDQDWTGWSIFLGHDPLPGLLENVAVMYLGKYASDPENVYQVDICHLGKSELNHIAIRLGFRIIRMWKYDPALRLEAKQAVALNCSSYHGSENTFIVQNIHGLCADLFNVLPVITL